MTFCIATAGLLHRATCRRRSRSSMPEHESGDGRWRWSEAEVESRSQLMRAYDERRSQSQQAAGSMLGSNHTSLERKMLPPFHLPPPIRQHETQAHARRRRSSARRH